MGPAVRAELTRIFARSLTFERARFDDAESAKRFAFLCDHEKLDRDMSEAQSRIDLLTSAIAELEKEEG